MHLPRASPGWLLPLTEPGPVAAFAERSGRTVIDLSGDGRCHSRTRTGSQSDTRRLNNCKRTPATLHETSRLIVRPETGSATRRRPPARSERPGNGREGRAEGARFRAVPVNASIGARTAYIDGVAAGPAARVSAKIAVADEDPVGVALLARLRGVGERRPASGVGLRVEPVTGGTRSPMSRISEAASRTSLSKRRRTFSAPVSSTLAPGVALFLWCPPPPGRPGNWGNPDRSPGRWFAGLGR